jgi:hypothetical protein
VRPLLTFYGVACLSRALVLLLRESGGEEGLANSHGLETANWKDVMAGDVADALMSLSKLRIRTTAGLFSEFVDHTKNRMSVHVNSSAVDWQLCYEIPPVGEEITLDELFARLPDLKSDYTAASGATLYCTINKMTYSSQAGVMLKYREDAAADLKSFYVSKGYTASSDAGWCTLNADAKTFDEHIPLFIHSYIHKHFGSIPSLFLSLPFASGARYSQLAITYMVGYVLGMLVRYYPTHWMALFQSEKGDTWWPTINRAQHIVEVSFPELVIELIQDILKTSKEKVTY